LAQFDTAVIGLGAIGLPVAKNLSKTFTVQGWNRSPVSQSNLKSSSVVLVAELRELHATNYLVALSDEAATIETLDKGLLEILNPDDLIIVLSTISPEAMHKIQAKIQSKGARIVDAPVSGGDIGAQRGELSIMISGEPKDCARAEEFLKQTAKSIRNVGTLGKAQTLKACNQIIVGAHLVALAESLALARRNGVSDQDFFDVISNGLAGSTALNVKWEKLVSGDFTQGGKSEYQLKDMRIALEIARQVSLKLPLSQTVAEIYKIHKELGNAALDHSSVLLQYLDKDEF
jgi:2-hydroxy-3-oxopropionate reductase